MTNTDVIDIIINKVKKLDLGHALNHIQDVAEQVLTEEEFQRYLIDSSKDADECDGMDGMLLNGRYFDWREFNWNKDQMVKSYLDYFTWDEKVRIVQHLQ